jgi:hypothetical protein
MAASATARPIQIEKGLALRSTAPTTIPPMIKPAPTMIPVVPPTSQTREKAYFD